MPAWLVDRIGIDYFRPVTIVVLYDNDAATDATIEQVGRITRLWRLMLIESSVNDASLLHLKGLTDLHSLELGGVRVTAAASRSCAGSDCVPEVPLDHHRNEGSRAKPVTTHGVVRGSDGTPVRKPQPPARSPATFARTCNAGCSPTTYNQLDAPARTTSSRTATELSACFCVPRPHLRIISQTDLDVRTQGCTSLLFVGGSLLPFSATYCRDRLLSDAEVSTRNGEALAVKSTSPP